MVDLNVAVKLQERTVVRKGLNGIRREGLVPAVVHNHGKESVHVMGPLLELEKIYASAGKHHPLNLEVGEQKYLALIKEVHFNPVKRHLEHLVFQAIRRDEKVEAEVPIHIEGEIPAEKVGLMILHQLDQVEVEALPADLPDELKVDGAKLTELHDKVTVADLQVPEGVTVLTDSEHPIATVVETKAQMSDEELAADAEAAEAAAAEHAAALEGAEGGAPEVPEGEQAADDSAEPPQNSQIT